MEYIEAIGRNPGEDKARSHLYEMVDGNYNNLLPMCRWGWNRSDGARLSVFRGHHGERGTCKICLRRSKAGLKGVHATPGSHKTKWL